MLEKRKEDGTVDDSKDAVAQKITQMELGTTNEGSTRVNEEEMGKAVDCSWGANDPDHQQSIEVGRRRRIAEMWMG